MCGIAGILTDEPGVDPAVAKRMVEAQRHRGPDAIGTFSPDSHFAASHARLSIVDTTEAGNQPFVSPAAVLVYNGEIYNHQALRPELTRLGATFQGTSDTATLFEALRLFGVEETLRRLRGMFAFAYYDIASQTMYLCRDRLGIKPLHYAKRGRSLFFSSEVKGIAAVTSVAVDPMRAVFAMSSVADDSLDRTAFRNVRQVAPGTMLVCKPGRAAEERRYYSPIDDFDEAHYRELEGFSETAIVEKFAALMAGSVQAMLMSDARLGVFVSGGIDSSLIALYAKRLVDDLPLFTSNVIGADSEVEEARFLGRSIHAELHESAFQPEDFLDQWAFSTWHYEYPIIRHMNSIPFGVVAGLARDTGVKVALTGEGSDELFLGYPKLLTRRFDGIARGPVNALLSLYGQVPGLRQHLWPDASNQPDGFINLLTQDYQRQRLREVAMPKLAFLGDDAAQEHYLTLQMLQEGLHSLLHRNDRMGMSHSIEARFPFLDEEVVRFGINLPAKFKIHSTTRFHNYKHPFLIDKWIVRTLARDGLPKRLVDMRKKGFPLAGYNAVRVAKSFFAGGFAEDALGLSPATLDYIVRSVPRKFVARLAAVDLMGRMFDMGWDVDQAREHVRANAAIAS